MFLVGKKEQKAVASDDDGHHAVDMKVIDIVLELSGVSGFGANRGCSRGALSVPNGPFGLGTWPLRNGGSGDTSIGGGESIIGGNDCS